MSSRHILAVLLAVALVVAPISPTLYAQEATTTPDTATTEPTASDTATEPTDGGATSDATDTSDSTRDRGERTDTTTDTPASTEGADSGSDSTTPTDSGSSQDSSTTVVPSAQEGDSVSANELLGGEVGTAATDAGDPAASSTSSTDSATVDPQQSDTDNSDFNNIGEAESVDPNKPIIDVSATTTEAAALAPVFSRDANNDGTGKKVGGTIFTGDARSTTTIKNTLNITRANVDGLGKTNSSHIRAETTNEAELTTDGSANAATGENNAQGGEGTATLITGNAMASADVVNVVNTNLFNSDGLVLFLNSQNGAKSDLRNYDLSYFFEGGPGESPTASSTETVCTVLTCLNSSDLEVLNTNTADVTNTVSVRADTGTNVASSTLRGDAITRTGDAYAAANVMNLVNTNFVNSSYFVVSYDSFGDLQSDIVLPDAAFFDQLLANGSSLPVLNSSSFVVDNNNDENFFGTTTANAITGGNTATTTGTGFGEVYTGTAQSGATNFTSVNQTKVGGSSVHFAFRVWGNWSGQVRNLPRGLIARATDYGFEIVSDGRSGTPRTGMGIYNSSQFVASSTNVANVSTDVDVTATTGENFVEVQDGVGTITSGKAFASANVINMVNTNVVNRNWVFGVFNIFGDFNGDISFGGLSPDLAVAASANRSAAQTNEEVEYDFTVQNNGESSASNVTLNLAYDRDQLSLTQVSSGALETTAGVKWNVGTLTPGQSRSYSATGRIRAAPASAESTIPVSVSASVTSAEHDKNSGDNVRDVRVTVSTPSPGSSPAPNPSPAPSPSPSPAPSPAPTPSPAPSPSAAPKANSGSSGGGGGGGGGGIAAGKAAAPYSSTTPVVFVSATSEPGVSNMDPNFNPKISVTKTAKLSASSTPSSIVVDYVVLVYNDKTAKSAYKVVLTDILYDPLGKQESVRSWNLGTLLAGDQVTLTYSLAFDAYKTRPGTYKNVARITGQRNSTTIRDQIQTLFPTEASGSVTFAVGSNTGQVLGATATGASCPLISSNIGFGLANNPSEVMKLQQFLNRDPETRVALSGPGSPGQETTVFGPLTRNAISALQRKYASEILHPLGLSAPTGSVYTSTRNKINALACGGASFTAASLPAQAAAALPTGVPAAPKAPASVPKPAATKKPQSNSNTRGAGVFAVEEKGSAENAGWLSKLFKW